MNSGVPPILIRSSGDQVAGLRALVARSLARFQLSCDPPAYSPVRNSRGLFENGPHGLRCSDRSSLGSGGCTRDEYQRGTGSSRWKEILLKRNDRGLGCRFRYCERPAHRYSRADPGILLVRGTNFTLFALWIRENLAEREGFEPSVQVLARTTV